MQLRKRTISATTEGPGHGVPSPETSSPRKTRKPRRPATNLPETENTSTPPLSYIHLNVPMVANDEQTKESMGGDESTEQGKAEDSGTVGPIPLAEDGQVPKINEPDEAEENKVSEDIQEDVMTCKKRRRVNSTSQPGIRKGKQRKEAASLLHNPTEQGVQAITVEGMKNLCDRDENGTQGPTDVVNPDDSSQTPVTREPTIGVILPFQRKDIHFGIEANDSNIPSSSVGVLTPKRQRRRSSQERDVTNTQESPTGWSARGPGKEIPMKSSDSELPDAPAYSTRKRTRVTYKETSDEEVVDESALLSSQDYAALASPQSQSTKKKFKAPASKDRVLEQPSPRTRKGRKNIWDKEVLLTSKISKLAIAADLTDVLNLATWELLSPEEKRECLNLLPVIDKVFMPPNASDANANPNGEETIAPDFFESNQVFKDSLVEFQDDLFQGRYEPSYLAEAVTARKARLEGVVDKYKDGQYELFWGQRQRGGRVAGAAANIRLPELIERGLLRAGDIWVYYRKMFETVIEKEVTVVEVTVNNGKYSLVFSIPPGRHKFSNPNRTDIVLDGVVSPSSLESAILRTHPNTPKHIPNGNAFRVFTIWRRGEDLGLLWEIRQTYWDGE